MPVAYHRGVREPGATAPVADAPTILVCGFVGSDARPFNPLIAALPRLLHLPSAAAGGWIARVIDQAAQESTEQRAGADAVLERLAEMMFVLANWRIQLGAGLLRDTRRTVASIAQDVGYESEAAFSRAFKRLVGAPPATWRRRMSNPPGGVAAA